jgi:Cof subfamily protein (haloacid dehalogenase superfamily)
VKKEQLNHSDEERNKGLFITDFDGTLLRSDGTLARKDLDALQSLTRCGVKTAVATGRSLYSFYNSPGVDLPVDYIIFSCGAGVIAQSTKKLVHQINIESELVIKTLAFMQDSSFDFMLHYPVPDNHNYLYRRFNQDNLDFENRIEKYQEFGRPLNSSPPDGFGEAAQFLAIIPQDRTDAALKWARTLTPGLSVIRSTSPLDHKSTWIEVFSPGVSKSSTSAWLASELKVDRANTMAIGNDYNDQDMLEWAARSFVVENAPDELKSCFKEVASNNNGGVAEAIEDWLDNDVNFNI